MEIRNDPNLRFNIWNVIEEGGHFEDESEAKDNIDELELLFKDIFNIPYQDISFYFFPNRYYLPYYDRSYPSYYDEKAYNFKKLLEIYNIQYKEKEINNGNRYCLSINFILPILIIPFDLPEVENFNYISTFPSLLDAVLIGRDETFDVSLFLLVTRGGEYFKRNLSFKQKERKFELKFSSDVLDAFVFYLYSGAKSLYESNKEFSVKEMYQLADYLICEPLITMCHKIIQDKLLLNDTNMIRELESFDNIDPILEKIIKNNNNVSLLDYIKNREKEEKVWYYGPLAFKNDEMKVRYFQTRSNDTLFIAEIKKLIKNFSDSIQDKVNFYLYDRNAAIQEVNRKMLEKYGDTLQFSPALNYPGWYRSHDFIFFKDGGIYILYGKLPYQKFELTTPTFNELSYFSNFPNVRLYDYVEDGFRDTSFLKNSLPTEV